MKKIAIKPHKTRGKEVISILEKNGGVNCNEYSGTEHIEHPVAYYVAVDHYIVFSNITFLEQRGYKIYTLEEWEDECKSDEMIEGLAEEETLIERVDDKGLPFNEWLSHKGAFHIPDGYELKDENGNVINARKIVLEKEKKKYPKTYEECCTVLQLNTFSQSIVGYKYKLITKFQQLLICRDAYWKIAGEEMGLGKPWEPTNGKGEKVYSIVRECGTIKKNSICDFSNCYILEFPTKEMRDAFYENFKELIESVKELL